MSNYILQLYLFDKYLENRIRENAVTPVYVGHYHTRIFLYQGEYAVGGGGGGGISRILLRLPSNLF